MDPKKEERIKKVEEVYTERAESHFKNDPTNRWDYLYSKLTSDYWLLSKIDVEGRRVLNIGCAQPRDEIVFVSKIKEWIAIDLNKEIVKSCRLMIEQELNPILAERIKFQVADATNLSFPDNSFDIAVSFSTIDHIPSPEGRRKAIEEMSRVTKKNGYVVITVPNKLNFAYWLWIWNRQRKQKKSQGAYEYCFFPWKLKRYMKEAGLRPLEFSSNFKFAPGIWFRPFRLLSFPIEYLGFRMGYLAKKL